MACCLVCGFNEKMNNQYQPINPIATGAGLQRGKINEERTLVVETP
jgi:hypothetical protein